VPVAPLPVALALLAALVAPAAPAVPAAVPVECDITDATLTWGFKDSFRAYIDSDIANGEWTTDGDVTYDTPAFTWTGGTGTYTPIGDGAVISFTGSVRFTGHEGVLDTTIADPVVRLGGGTGVLLLDVSGPTMDGTPVDVQDVPFVDLPVAEVAGGDAVRTIEADTVLTEDGNAAFPNYEVGTAFDPVSVSITVGKDCPPAEAVDDVDTADAASPLLVGLIIAGGLAAAAIIAAVVVLTRRRRA
jgi:hypothetical protein